MAFKVRCEYFNLSRDGVGTVILDEAYADATEHTSTVTDQVLPATNGAYAMCVTCLTGGATVEVSNDPSGTPQRGKLVTADGASQHWFVINANDKMCITEYSLA